MGQAEGPAHFLEAQRLSENDGTPYFVSLAWGTKVFFYILRNYGTPLAIFWKFSIFVKSIGNHLRVFGWFFECTGVVPWAISWDCKGLRPMPPPLSMVSAMIHLAGTIQNPANVSVSKAQERNDDTGKRPLQYKRRASGCEHPSYMLLCQ